MNQAEENNLQLSIDKVNAARDLTKARQIALTNEGKSIKLANGSIEKQYKELQIKGMTEETKMLNVLLKSLSVVGNKTASDQVELLLSGKKKQRNFVTNSREVPPTTKQVYDTKTMHSDVDGFSIISMLSKRVRYLSKVKYITALDENLFKEATSFADTMLPNSTTGESFKALFGANVEAFEAKEKQRLADRRKKRKDDEFLFGYTRTEWNKMILDQNNGRIVHLYNNNSTVPSTKKMKYNTDNTALEYVDL